jgi:hypothetical protein
MTDDEHEHKPLIYFVNGEEQKTDQRELAVRVILKNAGFDPAEQYQLERDAGHHIYENYDEGVHLHEGERFTATYLGPTPTS